MPAPVVFIHGMFMNPLCWDEWAGHFEAAGRAVTAPAWPGHEGTPAELRLKQPNHDLGRVGLTDVVDAIAEVIDRLGEKPVLVGHSMGGLVAQLLLARGVAVACVAVDSAPPSGVFTAQPSFLKSNWPMINPLHPLHEPHMITFEEFAYAFANTLDEEDQRAAYERYMVPESRKVPRDSLGQAGHVDFSAPHAPLLLISGGEDHIIPAVLNRHNFTHYQDPDSVTDLKEFPGRDHLTIVEPGWEGVAGFALEWLTMRGL
jgi:pimeloyl-ACP methyl ester carboxylesterase